MDEEIVVKGYAASERDVPGSAAKSEAPAACLTFALMLGIILFYGLPYVTYDVLGTVVAICEVLIVLSFLAVGAWARAIKYEPDATLGDLMPQRVIAGCLVFMALLGAFVLIPIPL